MASLRSAHAPRPTPAPEVSCVDTFERELDYVYATLQRVGARPDDMDDLLQDVFLILCHSWPRLDVSRPLRPWLFGVAFRVVRTQRRRRARERCQADLDLEDAALSPEAWVEGQESLAVLSAALERVPIARRAVLVMHEIDGLEVVDIARKLAITKFGVYARLYKARKELASAVRRLRAEGIGR